ncbi:MAG: DUF5702 domain-containing protein [Saccharofermentanales bacterium]
MRNNKRGGFTCFLAIIITSVIVLMTVLMNASSIRSSEALLAGILSGQQDLLLSGYSEKFLDWYGIYALHMQDIEENGFFKAVEGIREIKSYSCKGIYPLEKEGRLKKGIVNFAYPRFPMEFLLQFLSRFTQIDAIISNNSIGKAKVDPDIPVNAGNDSDPSFENSDIDYIKIIDSLSSISKNIYDKCISGKGTGNGTALPSWDEFNSLLDNSRPELYETDISKQMKSSLSLTETNLNDISAFLEQFYQFKLNPIYEKLCFEFYVSSMFSCKTNSRTKDGVEVQRKDMRGRIIEDLPVRNKLELEKIVFGNERNETNDFFAKMSIESMRFICHLVANLTNEAKKAEIKGISAGLCTAVLVASGGSVVIPPEAMDIVVLLLLSINSASLDYKSLIDGNPVQLLPAGENKNIDTYYIDYMQLLLLTVPEELKIDRILMIMKENLCLEYSDLFTGVKISTKYRENTYEVEGQYYGYDKTNNQE